MKLPDGLRGIRQLAFDTAPLIYFVERHPSYFDRMLFIMRYVDSGLIAGVAFTMALAEVLVQVLRAGDKALTEHYEAILSKSHNFRLEPVMTMVARQAADLRARYNLRTPDALHVATAMVAGCDAFLTNDTTLQRVKEIAVLLLDELELDSPEV